MRREVPKMLPLWLLLWLLLPGRLYSRQGPLLLLLLLPRPLSPSPPLGLSPLLPLLLLLLLPSLLLLSPGSPLGLARAGAARVRAKTVSLRPGVPHGAVPPPPGEALGVTADGRMGPGAVFVHAEVAPPDSRADLSSPGSLQSS